MGTAGYVKEGTDFYRDFNTDMATVCRAVKICPASASRFSNFLTREKNAEKILDYLEEIIIQDYNYEISESIDEIKKAIGKIEKSWNEYQRKENALEKYRRHYGVNRKQTIPIKIMSEEVLKNVLSERINTSIKAKRK